MRHLFTPEGQAALAAVLESRPLLAFDFDGTLASIVDRPQDARVPAAVVWRLEQLARVLPLAIVTGRSVDDVRQRLGFKPHFIVGNHGAEGFPGSAPDDWPAQLDPLRAYLREHAAELMQAKVGVEDKRYTISLHYRLARDRGAALHLIESLVASLGSGLSVFGGKLVVNVAAAAAPNKAQAVLALVRECDAMAAVYVGDDVTDEPVFAHAEPHWLTIRIGRDDHGSKAMYWLEDPAAVASLLQRMLDLTGVLHA